MLWCGCSSKYRSRLAMEPEELSGAPHAPPARSGKLSGLMLRKLAECLLLWQWMFWTLFQILLFDVLTIAQELRHQISAREEKAYQDRPLHRECTGCMAWAPLGEIRLAASLPVLKYHIYRHYAVFPFHGFAWRSDVTSLKMGTPYEHPSATSARSCSQRKSKSSLSVCHSLANTMPAVWLHRRSQRSISEPRDGAAQRYIRRWCTGSHEVPSPRSLPANLERHKEEKSTGT